MGRCCATRSTSRLTTANARSRFDLRRQRSHGLGRGQLAQDREQARQQRQIVADGVGERRLLQLALLHRALEQRGRAVDHLVERVVGDGLVLATGAAQDDAAGVARLVEDGLGERALADARLARDERHVAALAARALEQIAQDRALGGASDDAAVGERGKLVRAPLARAVPRRRRRGAARLERLTRGARRGEALLGTLGQKAQHPQLEIGRDALDAIRRRQRVLVALRVRAPGAADRRTAARRTASRRRRCRARRDRCGRRAGGRRSAPGSCTSACRRAWRRRSRACRRRRRGRSRGSSRGRDRRP